MNILYKSLVKLIREFLLTRKEPKCHLLMCVQTRLDHRFMFSQHTHCYIPAFGVAARANSYCTFWKQDRAKAMIKQQKRLKGM